MIYEIEGKLIEKFDENIISDRFKKREIVVERIENFKGKDYVDYVKFQLINDKTGLVDDINFGEGIKIRFAVKGNKWEKDGKVSYFTNLDAISVERSSMTQASEVPDDFQYEEDDDDVPF